MKKYSGVMKKPSLIDSAYTLRFATWFLALTLAAFAILGGSLLLLLYRQLGVSYFQDIATLSHLQEKLNLIFLATGVIQVLGLGAVFLVIALFWAHKVAGPVVRFRRCLSSLGQRSPGEMMMFRGDDQLQYLAVSFRKAQEAFCGRQDQLEKLFSRAEGILNEYQALSDKSGTVPVRASEKLNELKAVYCQIKGTLRKTSTDQPL